MSMVLGLLIFNYFNCDLLIPK